MFNSEIFFVVLYWLAVFTKDLTTATITEFHDRGTGPYFETEGNYTAAVGSNFTIKCLSGVPISLIPVATVYHLDEMDMSPSLGEKYENFYVMKRQLTNLTYRDIGKFSCSELHKDRPKSVFFYLFVDDPVHLMLGPRVVSISAKPNTSVLLPCLPTSSDVTVSLLTSSGDPMSISTVPQDEGGDEIYYHPTRGFMLPSKLITAYSYIRICEFSKRGVKQRKYIDVFLNKDQRQNFVYLEREVGAETKEITAEPGTDVQFLVHVFSNYEPTIEWRDGQGNQMKDSKKYSIDDSFWFPRKNRLKIFNVTKTDSGFYTAKATNSNTIDFVLHVGGIQTLHIEMKKVYLITDDEFMAYCHDRSVKREHNVNWSLRRYDCQPGENCEVITPMNTRKGYFYDEYEEITGRRRKSKISFEMYKNSITIIKPTLGNLTCTMEFRDHTKASVTRPLIVSEAKDGFEIKYRYRKYGDTWTANLICTVSRFLYSENVYWIGSDGFVIEKSRKEEGRTMTASRSETTYSYRVTLVIELKVNYLLRPEEYKCMAVDYDHVPSFKSHQLNIEAGGPAKIVSNNMKNESRFLALNANLSLTCFPDGWPSPNLHWYKDEVKIRNDGRHRLDLHLQMNATGRYSCRVANDYGEDYAYIDVEVYYPVPFSTDNTDEGKGYTLKKENGEIPERVTLLCSSDGKYLKDWVWYKDSHKVFESSHINIRDNGTIISIFPVTAKDLGFYTCKQDKEHQVNENALNIAAPVVGSILAFLIVAAVIFVGMRIRNLRTSSIPLK